MLVCGLWPAASAISQPALLTKTLSLKECPGHGPLVQLKGNVHQLGIVVLRLVQQGLLCRLDFRERGECHEDGVICLWSTDLTFEPRTLLVLGVTLRSERLDQKIVFFLKKYQETNLLNSVNIYIDPILRGPCWFCDDDDMVRV